MKKHPKRSDLPCPMMIIKDIEPYQSIVEAKVVNGKIEAPVIGGRMQQREERARAADRGLVPWEPVSDKPRGYINEDYCRRAGVKTSESAKEWAKKKRAAQVAKARECVNPKF